MNHWYRSASGYRYEKALAELPTPQVMESVSRKMCHGKLVNGKYGKLVMEN
jgi:hypothetical protein